MDKKLHIAIVGLGLIGGSILRGLISQKNIVLSGVSRSQETLDKASELYPEGIFSKTLSIVKDADIVFVCTPINKTLQVIDELADIVKSECIVTDVAGIKAPILDHVNMMPKKLRFIGGHPMAGTENKGIDASFEDLFKDAKWVLIPSAEAADLDVKLLKSVINTLRAKVIFADAKGHDKAVSLISHFPLLLSQSLFEMVNNYPDENIKNLALSLAASGFRDTTRLSATNPELAKDMLVSNKNNLKQCIKELSMHLEGLYSMLEKDDVDFTKHIEQIAKDRSSMYSETGKNIYSENS